ncbi:SurA N-terminal domain-containing protein [Bacillota bacterium LX-D]|nr:SurA N-terminal domain-containing protein [Bacillota bacterium LX-D]
MTGEGEKQKINPLTYLVMLMVLLGVVLAIVTFYTKQDVVARVNGEDITKEELYNYLVKESGQDALNTLIAEKITEQEANKQNIKITDQDIEKEMQKIYKSYGGQATFEQFAASNGYSMEDVKKDLVMSLKLQKLLGPQIKITEAEMKSYFAKNKDSFPKNANYADSKAEIKEALFNEKIQTEYYTWLQKKYQESKVENFLEKK